MTFKNIFIIAISLAAFTSCIKSSDTPPPDQLSVEVANINNILLQNTKDTLFLTSKGIGLAVHSFGENTPPHGGQVVKFKYEGRLLSDQSLIDSGTFNGPLNNFNVIGVQMGLATLPTGSSSLIYVPSAYAYGTSGKGKVPGNATLVYEVHLISTTKTMSEQVLFDKDTAAIHKYLVDSNITTAVRHSSGIWYDILTDGTGSKPNIFNKITGPYSGSLLSNGYIFDTGDLTDLRLLDLIDGFKVGIPLLKQGTKARLYIPSGLAYAARGATGIPANAPLIFEVTLSSFSK
jgi:FKBP-type peptidyl-prolyl cis-trans isomerase FkpA